MKVLDVDELYAYIDTLAKTNKNFLKQLTAIETSIISFISMDEAFRGLGGKAIRSFYARHHLPVLIRFISIIETFDQKLVELQYSVQEYESNGQGYIKETYMVNELENGLKKINDVTIQLTNEANAIIDSVKSIVDLPNVHDESVLNGVTQSKQKRDLTIGQLYTLDMQQTKNFGELDDPLHDLSGKVDDLIDAFQQGMMQSYLSEDIVKPFIETFKGNRIHVLQYMLSGLDAAFENFGRHTLTYQIMKMENQIYDFNGDSHLTFISEKEFLTLKEMSISSTRVFDEYIQNENPDTGMYYILPNSKIVHEYIDVKGNKFYSYVDEIPDDNVGGVQFKDSLLDGTSVEFIEYIDLKKGLRDAAAFFGAYAFKKVNDVTKKNTKKNLDEILSDVKTDKDAFVGMVGKQLVVLKDVPSVPISYVKRDRVFHEKLRNEFGSGIRRDFLKSLTENPMTLKQLKELNLTEKDIDLIKNGRLPKGYEVHHKLPLDDSGDNSFENLILIKKTPYHSSLTNEQMNLTKELQPGESKKIDFPIPKGSIFNHIKDGEVIEVE